MKKILKQLQYSQRNTATAVNVLKNSTLLETKAAMAGECKDLFFPIITKETTGHPYAC